MEKPGSLIRVWNFAKATFSIVLPSLACCDVLTCAHFSLLKFYLSFELLLFILFYFKLYKGFFLMVLVLA